MKRLKLVAGTAVVAASLTLASAATPEEPADALVFDAMTAPATISYSGTVEAIDLGNHSEAAVYRIEHRAPDLTQRYYLSPPRLHGDSVVSRGEASYFVDPARRRIVETENASSNDQFARDDNYLLLRANYRAERRSAEPFDGRTVREVALINKYTNRVTMLVRIDEQTKLVLDKQQFGPDGSLASETRFEDVRYAPSPPSTDFTVPRGMTVVHGPTFTTPSKDVPGVVRSAGFAAVAPKFLPHGFAPVEAEVAPIKGVRTLHVLYSDGVRTVSLFENVAAAAVDLNALHPQPMRVSGRDAEYAERGPTTLLVWSYDNLHCALVGELPVQELQRIAASVSP